ncbi:MAG: hypothetical protein H6729_14275 [Deltaproteobacteria bacterium]|nr:hypothetical protein [Deltaproteobacteria bacterium]
MLQGTTAGTSMRGRVVDVGYQGLVSREYGEAVRNEIQHLRDTMTTALLGPEAEMAYGAMIDVARGLASGKPTPIQVPSRSQEFKATVQQEITRIEGFLATAYLSPDGSRAYEDLLRGFGRLIEQPTSSSATWSKDAFERV